MTSGGGFNGLNPGWPNAGTFGFCAAVAVFGGLNPNCCSNCFASDDVLAFVPPPPPSSPSASSSFFASAIGAKGVVNGNTVYLAGIVSDGASVRGLVLGQVVRMTIVGGVLGLLAAIAIGRAAASLLYGLQSWDPVVLSSSAVLLTLVATAAGWLPALRASRVAPMVALRDE